MGKLNKIIGGGVLGGTALGVAKLAGNETANGIVQSLSDTVSDSTDLILSALNVPTELSSFIAENAPVLTNGWESLVGPGLFGIAGMASGNYASKKLGNWTGTDNKIDDNIAGTAGLVGGVGFGLGSVTMASAGLTGLSYVGSRKIIEKMLPANYIHLAKYIALAPAGFVASSTGLVDASASVLAPILAGTAMFGINRFRA